MPANLHTFESRFQESWPTAAWQDVSVVLAVSGGADSVALLRAMTATTTTDSGKVIVAHFNHKLRGADSDKDQQFVQELSRAWNLPFRTKSAERIRDDPATSPYDSPTTSEDFARNARYEFLLGVAREFGARYVATAHTFDDQAETVLHRIIRGTGLNGLRGIRRVRPLSDEVALIRPFLSLRRADVLAYLGQLNQPFRSDHSNLQAIYTRNRIRLELMPLLAEQFNASVDEALVRLSELAGEACDVIQPLVEQLQTRAVLGRSHDRVALDIDQLLSDSAYLRRELFITIWDEQNWPRGDMSFDAWQQLVSLADASMPTCRITLPGNIRAEKERGQVVLTRVHD